MGKESACSAGDTGDVGFIPQEYPLEKDMATHSNIIAWKIPWSEEPGGLQSIGSQKIRHNWVTEHTGHTSLVSDEQSITVFFFFFSFADLINNSLQCSNFSNNLSNLHTWREKWVFSAIFTEERNRISLRWRAWLYILWKVGSHDSTDTNPSIRSLASLPLGKEDVQAVGCTTPEGAARPCEDENAGRQPRGPVKTRGLPISSSNLLLMVWHRTGNIVSDTLWPSRLLLSVWPSFFTHACQLPFFPPVLQSYHIHAASLWSWAFIVSTTFP